MELPQDIEARILRADEDVDWRTVLSEREQRRLATFRSERRREAFARGRVAARRLLAERLSIEPAAVVLDVAEDGSLVAPGTGLCVSIAHSGAWAAAAVGSRPVGIDLERVVSRRPDLCRFFLHPSERPTFEALPLDRTRAQLLYWTVKEATLKGLRTGLRMSPKKLLLELDLPSRSARVLVEGKPSWRACFDEGDGFLWAVAFLPDR